MTNRGRERFLLWPGSLEVSLAGLELLAGDSSTALQIAAETQVHPDKMPSDDLNDLGRWFYLAGQYPKTNEVLSLALQWRPGDAVVAERLAWTVITGCARLR